jgi:hypothetical protein
MKDFRHIKHHEVLEKRIIEGYISGKSKRGDQKGNGFRISQMICKGVHQRQDILLMIERSLEELSMRQSFDRNMLLNVELMALL